MPGIGVLANVVAVLIGGVLGLGGGRFLAERFQATLMRACALVVIFLGLGGALSKMLVVGADGRAYAAQPVQSSGSPSLDRAAVKAMDGARFTPARFRGRPVWAAARRSIRFAIK